MNDAASYQHGGEVWRRHRFGSKIGDVFLALLWGAGKGLLFLFVFSFFSFFFTVLHLKCC